MLGVFSEGHHWASEHLPFTGCLVCQPRRHASQNVVWGPDGRAEPCPIVLQMLHVLILIKRIPE